MARNRWRRLSGKGVAISSRLLNKYTSRLHTALYRRTGGRVGGRAGFLPTLLLTTTGRKSGLARTVPINYIHDGDSYVVIASNSGRDTPPLWYLNLRSKPSASIEVRQITIPVQAREATPEEWRRLWPRIVRRAYNYEEYRKRASRHIPLVILTRRRPE